MEVALPLHQRLQLLQDQDPNLARADALHQLMAEHQQQVAACLPAERRVFESVRGVPDTCAGVPSEDSPLHFVTRSPTPPLRPLRKS